MDLFRTGAQCGALPEQVLDMSLEQFTAVVSGYSEHLQDQQEVAVTYGYWAGYYSGEGRKKPVKMILDAIEKARYKKTGGTRATDVNVDTFLERERKFKERIGR